MRVLFIGDIFSKPGLKVVQQFVPKHRDSYDFIIANGENAAGGFGLTRRHFKQLTDLGVDVVTMGNHTWDRDDVTSIVEETPRLIRPLNYPPGTPGLGAASFEAHNGERITVAQALGQVYMNAVDCPFRALDTVANELPKGETLVVDFHAEATSEKKSMGYHLRGRATAVIGTHTHVQTADAAISQGTATITDVGMTGVQDSAIGMDHRAVHQRFVTKMPIRFKPAEQEGTLCAVVIETENGRATSIERIQWRAGEDD
ncbi:MAG: TIGR00282 family metallophosphoesterase [Trueperaceae bacterium]|nr:TIGR00282 family metallophosphoesterase [Trueperaceae bacterium]